MASRAREKGAIILESTAARGIETGGGSVCGVITEKGRIDCKAVLVAGGVWSRLFCRPLAIDVPQLKILSSVMRTHPIKGCPEVSASGHGFAFRKRLDGGYTVANGNIINYELVPDSLRLSMRFLPLAWKARKELRLRFSNRFGIERRESNLWLLDQPGPFEMTRILNPNPVRQELHSAKQNLISAYPSFGELQIAEEWAGMIDVTPDAIPIISAVPDLSGLFLATGFSGHGFGLGPAAGELAVDLVANSAPIVDPQPFVLSRFSDGSRVRPVVGI
jgi:glycine/D-amino acid oxidase-like deaminating enzyme